MSNSRLILAALLATGISGFTVAAQAADPVTDAMQKTYAPYRVALFKTNSNAQDESRQAVLQAQQGWNRIVADYGARPPVPYDRDPEFAGSLAKVGTVYAKAAAEIERNELAVAHDTLEQVREVMAGIRQRNQVVVFSDHMNAYHAQMERVLIDGGKMLAEPDGLLQLTAQVGALDYLAGRLKSEAPADHRQNEEFSMLYQAVEKSVADLKAALFAQDAAKVKEAMGKIKGPYSKMFIKFG
jgi:hypothetical protein